jgi:hypothetical protein
MENIFDECSSIKSLTLPFLGRYLNDNDGSRLKLGYTFGSFKPSNFTSVEILHGNTIGNDAFKGYSNLSSIKIPDEVTVIGNSAFELLSSFKSISFPSRLEEIGNSAFRRTGITSINIPDTVESIGTNAFEECTSLSSVYLPSAIETLPNGIFSMCSNLSVITLPQSIKTIGISAFQGCTDIMQISLPYNLETIGSAAFAACESLGILRVPDSVTSIGPNLVANDRGLEELNLPFLGLNKDDTTTATLARLISTTGAQKLKVVRIHEASEIYENAFKDFTTITQIVLPNLVSRIGNSAFRGCTSLSTFNIPTGLQEVGDYAFYETKIKFNSLPEYMRNIGDYAFYGCTEIPNFTLPRNIERIGQHAFHGCTTMTSLIIPESIKRISEGAYENCTGLIDVEVNGNPDEIRHSVFKGCTNIKNLTLPFLGQERNNYSKSVIRHSFGDSQGGSVTVPSNIKNITILGNTSLGERTFYDIPSLESVIFQGQIEQQNDGLFESFWGCTNLTAVQLPSGGGGTYEVGQNCFRNCTSLESIVIPNNVREIMQQAFKGCTSLKDITYPTDLISLGGGAFEGCTSLDSFVAPSKLIRVEGEVFKGCTSLTSAVFGNSLTSLGAELLKGSYITTLSIPFVGNFKDQTSDGVFARFYDESYTTASKNSEAEVIVTNLTVTGDAPIKDKGLKNMTGLKQLTITNSNVTMVSGFLEGCTGLETLTVTHLGLSKNDADTSTLTSWGFATSSNLKTINITGETMISNNAFKNFTNLETINISGTLLEDRKIGDYAFQGLTDFDFANNLTLPSNVEILGEGCFASNTFTSITLPEGILEFEDRVFGNCTNLHHFKFPDSVLRIGDSIFQGCTAIIYIIYSDFNSGDSGINQIATLTSLKWVIYKSPVIRSGFFYQNNTSDRISVYIDRDYPDITNNDLTNTNALLGSFDFNNRWNYGPDGIPTGAPS